MSGLKPLSDSAELKLQFLLAFFSAIALLAVHFSPALASIVTGIFIATGLFGALRNRVPVLKKNVLLLFLLLFVWQAISALLNPPMALHSSKLLLKLPFLFVPFLGTAFIWGNRIFSYWLLAVCIPLTCMVLASLVNYFMHYEFYNIMVLESKPVPIYSKLYHIEFSLFIAVMLLLILQFILNPSFRESLYKPFLLICFVIGVAGLHVFAVRTAMLLFYTGLGVLAVGNYKFWIKKWWLPTGALLLAALVFISIPSLRNRIINTADDAGSILNKGELNNKSGGLRVVAWKTALQASKTRLSQGYGPGGAEKAMFDTYTITGTGILPSNWKMPHNQWLEFLLQSGWPAVLLFSLGMAALFFYTDLFGKAMIAGVLVASVFESLLERQDGFLMVLTLILMAASRGVTKNIKKN